MNKLLAITVAGVCMGIHTSVADPVVLTAWNSHNPSTMPFPYQAPTKDSLVSSATWTPVGLTYENDSRGVYSSYDNGDYLEFALQLSSGVAFDKFYHCAASVTSQQLELRSSADNYATALGGYALTSSYVNYAIDISSLSSVSDITFRLYGTSTTGNIRNLYSVGATSSYANYDPIQGSSTVVFTGSAIPEPATLGLVSLLAGGIFAVRRIFMI